MSQRTMNRILITIVMFLIVVIVLLYQSAPRLLDVSYPRNLDDVPSSECKAALQNDVIPIIEKRFHASVDDEINPILEGKNCSMLELAAFGNGNFVFIDFFVSDTYSTITYGYSSEKPSQYTSLLNI